jgi:hypothetical protein
VLSFFAPTADATRGGYDSACSAFGAQDDEADEEQDQHHEDDDDNG